MIKGFADTKPKGEDFLNRKKMALSILLAVSLAVLAAGVSTAATAKAATKPAPAALASAVKLPGGNDGRDAFFVTLEWLRNNLKGVVLLDARPASLYAGGHIPGALNAEWQSFSKMSGLPGSKGWATLLPQKSLAARIGALGIDGSRPVIVYGEPGSWGQEGFVALTLRMAGVSGVRILDGGWTAYRSAGLPVTRDVPKNHPVSFVIRKYDEKLNATTETIREKMGTAKLLDARTLEEYKGARYFGEKRGGHLPGAILVPYNQLVGKDGLLLPETDLRALFEGAGIRAEDEVIVYDTAGIRSAFVSWVLLMLGYPQVKNYDASYHEWAGITELSVETEDPGSLPVLKATPGSIVPKALATSPASPASPEAGQNSLNPAPAAITPVKVQVQSPDLIPASKDALVLSGDTAGATLEGGASKDVAAVAAPGQVPFTVPLVSAQPKPAVQAKPMPEAGRIKAIRWNREGKTVRAVIDLDRVIEPKVQVKQGMVELDFDSTIAQSLPGLASPYGKQVSVVALESGNTSILRFSYQGKGVKHFKLESPYRYVIDFQF